MVDIAPGLDRFEARAGADEHRRLDVPRRGLVGPVRHVGARRHDQGRGRRRRRADARRGRPAARAGGGAHGRRRDVAGGRPGAHGRGHRRCATSATPPRRGSRPGCPRKVHAALAEHPLRDAGDALAGLPAGRRPPARPRRAPGTSCSRARRARSTTPTAGKWASGTLRTAALDLPRIAGMGFDVVYLTPVHPIGDDVPQGPQQLARSRTWATRAPRTRSAPRRAGTTRSSRRWARSTTSTRSSPRRGTWAWRWRSTSRCSAPPTTRGSPSTRSGSPRGPTARSRTRRTRRRSTRTSTR